MVLLGFGLDLPMVLGAGAGGAGFAALTIAAVGSVVGVAEGVLLWVFIGVASLGLILRFV